MSNQRLTRTFFAIIVVGVMVVVWLNFAPAQFGGQAHYVIVAGTSMEPGFHRGDLVILRQTSDYRVGDIVTYRHPEIGPIIHRIIAIEAGRFVFKGDNNSWIDSYRPARDELIGTFWLHLPSAGKIVTQLRTPPMMALMVAAIGVIFMTTLTSPSRQPGRPDRRRSGTVAGKQSQSMSHTGDNKADLLLLLAAVALASLVLALFAFSRPIARTVIDPLPYEQRGAFSYSADAPPGIYTSNTVQTGEPIFRQLINQVTVNFDYEFAADAPATVAGTSRLLAEISHSNGWHWTLELQPATAFKGRQASVRGLIDLNQVQAVLDSVEQQTGLLGQQYTLAVRPEITVDGTLLAQPFQDSFSPQLLFQLDPLQMQLAAVNSRPVDTGDPFAPVQKGLLNLPREAPNAISIFGFEFKVAHLRLVALLGLLLSVGGLGVAGWPILSAWRGDEAARIQFKYGSLMIAVHDTGLPEHERVIEVASIDDLAKMAERDGRMILHQSRGLTHTYFVQDGPVTYRYQLEPSGQQESAL